MLQFTQLPSPWPFYRKALLSSKPKVKDGHQWPEIDVSYGPFQFSQGMIQQYKELCQIDASIEVPLLFPHSLFGPLHLAMLTQNEFPMKLLGAVHLRNHVIQRTPLKIGTEYHVTMNLNKYRRRPQGLEVDFTTSIKQWFRDSMGKRDHLSLPEKFKEEDAESSLASSTQNLSQGEKYVDFPVPSNIGKKFGWLTKDINPIHMSSILAKAFGFKRDLCHGMWALGRAVGQIKGYESSQAIRCDVSFKGPLYIGKDITVEIEKGKPGVFQLMSQGNDRPCVVGSIHNVAPGESLASY